MNLHEYAKIRSQARPKKLRESEATTPVGTTTLRQLAIQNGWTEREVISDWLGKDDYDEPLQIRTLSWQRIPDLQAPLFDGSVLDSFQGAETWQTKLVHRYAAQLKRGDDLGVVVLDGDTVIDGNHRCCAAHEAQVDLQYVDLAELSTSVESQDRRASVAESAGGLSKKSIRAVLAKLDSLEVWDEEEGCHYLDDPDFDSPRLQTSICTTSALWLAKQLGGTVVGYHCDPGSGKVGEHCSGHDFCLVNDRWIVDWWSSRLEQGVDVLDLQDPQDQAQALKLYGDKSGWEPVVAQVKEAKRKEPCDDLLIVSKQMALLLDTEGKFHWAEGGMTHEGAAREALGIESYDSVRKRVKYNDPDYDAEMVKGTMTLLRQGWVRIVNYPSNEALMGEVAVSPNSYQRQALVDLGLYEQKERLELYMTKFDSTEVCGPMQGLPWKTVQLQEAVQLWLSEGLRELLEGRKEEARKKYPDIKDYVFDEFVEGDPSGNQKYLGWLCKVWMVERDKYNANRAHVLVDLVQRFFRLKVKQDLYRFKDGDDLETFVSTEEAKLIRGTRKQIMEDQTEMIHQDSHWKVVAPLTHKSMRFWGGSTSWCVATSSTEHWADYAQRGSFVVVIDRTKTDEDDYFKLAIFSNGRENPSGWNIYDSSDHCLGREYHDAFLAQLGDDIVEKVKDFFESDDWQERAYQAQEEAFQEKFEDHGYRDLLDQFIEWSHTSVPPDRAKEIMIDVFGGEQSLKNGFNRAWEGSGSNYGYEDGGYVEDLEAFYRFLEDDELEEQFKECYNRLALLPELQQLIRDTIGDLKYRELEMKLREDQWQELETAVRSMERKRTVSDRPSIKVRNVPQLLALLRDADSHNVADIIAQVGEIKEAVIDDLRVPAGLAALAPFTVAIKNTQTGKVYPAEDGETHHFQVFGRVFGGSRYEEECAQTPECYWDFSGFVDRNGDYYSREEMRAILGHFESGELRDLGLMEHSTVVACPHCGQSFDYAAVPECSMGAVKCPSCLAVVSQSDSGLLEVIWEADATTNLTARDVYDFYFLWTVLQTQPAVLETQFGREIATETARRLQYKYVAMFRTLVANQIEKYVARKRIDQDFPVATWMTEQKDADPAKLLDWMKRTWRSDMHRRNTQWEEIATHLSGLAEAQTIKDKFFHIDRLNNLTHNTGTLVLDKLPGYSREQLVPALDFAAHARDVRAYKGRVSPDLWAVMEQDTMQESALTTALHPEKTSWEAAQKSGEFQIGFEAEYVFHCPSPETARTPMLKRSVAAKELATLLGEPVRVSGTSGAGDYKQWTIIGDTSVKVPDQKMQVDVEIVSPCRLLAEMLPALDKTLGFIAQTGHTDVSCGLHIGVSTVDQSRMAKVNPLKQLLLFGEKEVAHKFARFDVEPAQSVIRALVPALSRELKKRSLTVPQIEEFLNKIIFENQDRHMSINFTRLADENPYLEIRVPGGDRYETKARGIEAAVMRAVLALQASMDTGAHRTEYLAQLGRLIAAAREYDAHKQPKVPAKSAVEYLLELLKPDLQQLVDKVSVLADQSQLEPPAKKETWQHNFALYDRIFPALVRKREKVQDRYRVKLDVGEINEGLWQLWSLHYWPHVQRAKPTAPLLGSLPKL